MTKRETIAAVSIVLVLILVMYLAVLFEAFGLRGIVLWNVEAATIATD